MMMVGGRARVHQDLSVVVLGRDEIGGLNEVDAWEEEGTDELRDSNLQ